MSTKLCNRVAITHRLGRVVTTFLAEEDFASVVAARLRGYDTTPAPTSVDAHIRFELIDGPGPPAPDAEPIILSDPLAFWRGPGSITATRTGGPIGVLDLDRCEGTIWSGGDDHWSRWAAVHGVLRPLWAAALARQGLFAMHASGVVVGGRAIVMTGPSFAGKSTLASQLAADGAAFLSDDAVYVDDDGAVYGPGDCVRLRVQDPDSDIDGKITLELGEATTGPHEAGLLVLLEAVEGPTRITKVAPPDAMEVLLKAGVRMLDPEADTRRLAAMARLAEICTAVRLQRGPVPPSTTEVRQWLTD